MSEVVEKTPAKAKTEYEDVSMDDGSVVKFAGKRKLNKTVTTDVEGHYVTVRFDFRNGKTLTLDSRKLSEEICLDLLGHGGSQKCGDETAGVEKIEDQVLAVEEMIKRLEEGEWSVERQAGDGFSGASVVIRALVEVTGKTVDDIKSFLNGKLEAAKAKGEKLSRADLYASFRKPGTKTADVIERLEREERAKNVKGDADAMVAEMLGHAHHHAHAA